MEIGLCKYLIDELQKQKLPIIRTIIGSNVNLAKRIYIDLIEYLQ